ncbi:zinc ribbon domain-containing protein [Halovivax sp.]|uniref:zinc ribbon domain-containing protein n=1 Tax=Halovivax sp. TaxID=1935978 RepID=UPI0025C6533B|nr:zinc ribbon domain-containing protein [Halovivax sp.]
MRSGIAGVSAYVPRIRLEGEEIADAWGTGGPAGIERTAVPDADEDALTMAYEAAAAALEAADVAPANVGRLLLATTTPPLEEESGSARLASFVGLDADAAQLSGSTAAGVDALLTGLDGGGEPALVVASDAPRGAPDSDLERAAGAGAAAFVLTADGPGSVRDVASTIGAYPGTRFRPRGAVETRELGITSYDRTAFVETVEAVGDALEYDSEALDAVALQAPDGKLPYRACDALGVSSERVHAGTVVHDVGDAGVASPLLGLASAAADGHVHQLLVGYGSGAEASGAVLDLDDVPVRTRLEGTETVSYAGALRLRGEITPGEPEGGGAYVSVPTWRRSLPQRHRLVAGRCASCGGLNLPPDGACVGCHELAPYEEVTLPGTGTVEATTVIEQGGAPPEFVEQQARSGSFVSAIVALDGPDREDDGGRFPTDEAVSLPMQVLADETDAVEIGDRIETTIRRVYTQEGMPRYGRKAVLERARR